MKISEPTSLALRDSLKAAQDMAGYWDAEIARLQDKLLKATQARAACNTRATSIETDVQIMEPERAIPQPLSVK